MTAKRIREAEEETNKTVTDRLTDMPESLQLRIFSSLETRHAVKALMMLSKSWVSSWTCIPVLNFSSYSFHGLYAFDKYVYNVLSHRESVKLEKLTFKRGGTCRARILREVIDYAFSHDVRELEIDIRHGGEGRDWPIWSHASSYSLTSLKIESRKNDMGCSFLGPRSNSFKNLTNLHLKRVIIRDLDPFSGFPALDKLSILSCPLNINENVLNVQALRLSELTMSNDDHKRVTLTTPKLRYFEYRGIRLTTNQGGLPNLDTAVLDYNGVCVQNQEKIMFDDVLMLFNILGNAKSITLFSSILHLLALFPDDLVNQCSPFRDLKRLKLDFSFFYTQHLSKGLYKTWTELIKLLPGVKAYLLQNSHDSQCTMIRPCLMIGDSYTRRTH